MNTTTTKADLVKPKAVSEATSPRCEATLSKIRKHFSVEVWRESGETNERFLNWQSRKVENVISNVFAELAQVTAQRDELLERIKHYESGGYVEAIAAQRDELLAALKEAVSELSLTPYGDHGAIASRNTLRLLNTAITKAEQH